MSRKLDIEKKYSRFAKLRLFMDDPYAALIDPEDLEAAQLNTKASLPNGSIKVETPTANLKLPDHFKPTDGNSLEIIPLTSNSEGNAYVIKFEQRMPDGTTKTLYGGIDAGISKSHYDKMLSKHLGIRLNDIDFFLITHEHVDHAQRAGELAYTDILASTRVDTKIRTNPAYIHTIGNTGVIINSAEMHHGKRQLPIVTLDYNKPQQIITATQREGTGLWVIPFQTSHDAASPAGYVITDGNIRLGFATDLGTIYRHAESGDEYANGFVKMWSQLDGGFLEMTGSDLASDLYIRGGGPPGDYRGASMYGHLNNREAARLFEDAIAHSQIGRSPQYWSGIHSYPGVHNDQELIIETIRNAWVSGHKRKLDKLQLYKKALLLYTSGVSAEEIAQQLEIPDYEYERKWYFAVVEDGKSEEWARQNINKTLTVEEVNDIIKGNYTEEDIEDDIKYTRKMIRGALAKNKDPILDPADGRTVVAAPGTKYDPVFTNKHFANAPPKSVQDGIRDNKVGTPGVAPRYTHKPGQTRPTIDIGEIKYKNSYERILARAKTGTDWRWKWSDKGSLHNISSPGGPDFFNRTNISEFRDLYDDVIKNITQESIDNILNRKKREELAEKIKGYMPAEELQFRREQAVANIEPILNELRAAEQDYNIFTKLKKTEEAAEALKRARLMRTRLAFQQVINIQRLYKATFGYNYFYVLTSRLRALMHERRLLSNIDMSAVTDLEDQLRTLVFNQDMDGKALPRKEFLQKQAEIKSKIKEARKVVGEKLLEMQNKEEFSPVFDSALRQYVMEEAEALHMSATRRVSFQPIQIVYDREKDDYQIWHARRSEIENNFSNLFGWNKSVKTDSDFLQQKHDRTKLTHSAFNIETQDMKDFLNKLDDEIANTISAISETDVERAGNKKSDLVIRLKEFLSKTYSTDQEIIELEQYLASDQFTNVFYPRFGNEADNLIRAAIAVDIKAQEIIADQHRVHLGKAPTIMSVDEYKEYFEPLVESLGLYHVDMERTANHVVEEMLATVVPARMRQVTADVWEPTYTEIRNLEKLAASIDDEAAITNIRAQIQDLERILDNRMPELVGKMQRMYFDAMFKLPTEGELHDRAAILEAEANKLDEIIKRGGPDSLLDTVYYDRDLMRFQARVAREMARQHTANRRELYQILDIITDSSYKDEHTRITQQYKSLVDQRADLIKELDNLRSRFDDPEQIANLPTSEKQLRDVIRESKKRENELLERIILLEKEAEEVGKLKSDIESKAAREVAKRTFDVDDPDKVVDTVLAHRSRIDAIHEDTDARIKEFNRRIRLYTKLSGELESAASELEVLEEARNMRHGGYGPIINRLVDVGNNRAYGFPELANKEQVAGALHSPRALEEYIFAIRAKATQFRQMRTDLDIGIRQLNDFKLATVWLDDEGTGQLRRRVADNASKRPVYMVAVKDGKPTFYRVPPEYLSKLEKFDNPHMAYIRSFGIGRYLQKDSDLTFFLMPESFDSNRVDYRLTALTVNNGRAKSAPTAVINSLVDGVKRSIDVVTAGIKQSTTEELRAELEDIAAKMHTAERQYQTREITRERYYELKKEYNSLNNKIRKHIIEASDEKLSNEYDILDNFTKGSNPGRRVIVEIPSGPEIHPMVKSAFIQNFTNKSGPYSFEFADPEELALRINVPGLDLVPESKMKRLPWLNRPGTEYFISEHLVNPSGKAGDIQVRGMSRRELLNVIHEVHPALAATNIASLDELMVAQRDYDELLHKVGIDEMYDLVQDHKLQLSVDDAEKLNAAAEELAKRPTASRFIHTLLNERIEVPHKLPAIIGVDKDGVTRVIRLDYVNFDQRNSSVYDNIPELHKLLGNQSQYDALAMSDYDILRMVQRGYLPRGWRTAAILDASASEVERLQDPKTGLYKLRSKKNGYKLYGWLYDTDVIYEQDAKRIIDAAESLSARDGKVYESTPTINPRTGEKSRRPFTKQIIISQNGLDSRSREVVDGLVDVRKQIFGLHEKYPQHISQNDVEKLYASYMHWITSRIQSEWAQDNKLNDMFEVWKNMDTRLIQKIGPSYSNEVTDTLFHVLRYGSARALPSSSTSRKISTDEVIAYNTKLFQDYTEQQKRIGILVAKRSEIDNETDRLLAVIEDEYNKLEGKEFKVGYDSDRQILRLPTAPMSDESQELVDTARRKFEALKQERANVTVRLQNAKRQASDTFEVFVSSLPFRHREALNKELKTTNDIESVFKKFISPTHMVDMYPETIDMSKFSNEITDMAPQIHSDLIKEKRTIEDDIESIDQKLESSAISHEEKENLLTSKKYNQDRLREIDERLDHAAPAWSRVVDENKWITNNSVNAEADRYALSLKNQHERLLSELHNTRAQNLARINELQTQIYNVRHMLMAHEYRQSLPPMEDFTPGELIRFRGSILLQRSKVHASDRIRALRALPSRIFNNASIILKSGADVKARYEAKKSILDTLESINIQFNDKYRSLVSDYEFATKVGSQIEMTEIYHKLNSFTSAMEDERLISEAFESIERKLHNAIVGNADNEYKSALGNITNILKNESIPGSDGRRYLLLDVIKEQDWNLSNAQAIRELTADEQARLIELHNLYNSPTTKINTKIAIKREIDKLQRPWHYYLNDKDEGLPAFQSLLEDVENRLVNVGDSAVDARIRETRRAIRVYRAKLEALSNGVDQLLRHITDEFVEGVRFRSRFDLLPDHIDRLQLERLEYIDDLKLKYMDSSIDQEHLLRKVDDFRLNLERFVKTKSFDDLLGYYNGEVSKVEGQLIKDINKTLNTRYYFTPNADNPEVIDIDKFFDDFNRFMGSKKYTIDTDDILFDPKTGKLLPGARSTLDLALRESLIELHEKRFHSHRTEFERVHSLLGRSSKYSPYALSPIDRYDTNISFVRNLIREVLGGKERNVLLVQEEKELASDIRKLFENLGIRLDNRHYLSKSWSPRHVSMQLRQARLANDPARYWYVVKRRMARLPYFSFNLLFQDNIVNNAGKRVLRAAGISEYNVVNLAVTKPLRGLSRTLIPESRLRDATLDFLRVRHPVYGEFYKWASSFVRGNAAIPLGLDPNGALPGETVKAQKGIYNYINFQLRKNRITNKITLAAYFDAYDPVADKSVSGSVFRVTPLFSTLIKEGKLSSMYELYKDGLADLELDEDIWQEVGFSEQKVYNAIVNNIEQTKIKLGITDSGRELFELKKEQSVLEVKLKSIETQIANIHAKRLSVKDISNLEKQLASLNDESMSIASEISDVKDKLRIITDYKRELEHMEATANHIAGSYDETKLQINNVIRYTIQPRLIDVVPAASMISPEEFERILFDYKIDEFDGVHDLITHINSKKERLNMRRALLAQLEDAKRNNRRHLTVGKVKYKIDDEIKNILGGIEKLDSINRLEYEINWYTARLKAVPYTSRSGQRSTINLIALAESQALYTPVVRYREKLDRLESMTDLRKELDQLRRSRAAELAQEDALRSELAELERRFDINRKSKTTINSKLGLIDGTSKYATVSRALDRSNDVKTIGVLHNADDQFTSYSKIYNGLSEVYDELKTTGVSDVTLKQFESLRDLMKEYGEFSTIIPNRAAGQLSLKDLLERRNIIINSIGDTGNVKELERLNKQLADIDSDIYSLKRTLIERTSTVLGVDLAILDRPIDKSGKKSRSPISKSASGGGLLSYAQIEDVGVKNNPFLSVRMPDGTTRYGETRNAVNRISRLMSKLLETNDIDEFNRLYAQVFAEDGIKYAVLMADYSKTLEESTRLQNKIHYLRNYVIHNKASQILTPEEVQDLLHIHTASSVEDIDPDIFDRAVKVMRRYYGDEISDRYKFSNVTSRLIQGDFSFKVSKILRDEGLLGNAQGMLSDRLTDVIRRIFGVENEVLQLRKEHGELIGEINNIESILNKENAIKDYNAMMRNFDSYASHAADVGNMANRSKYEYLSKRIDDIDEDLKAFTNVKLAQIDKDKNSDVRKVKAKAVREHKRYMDLLDERDKINGYIDNYEKKTGQLTGIFRTAEKQFINISSSLHPAAPLENAKAELKTIDTNLAKLMSTKKIRKQLDTISEYAKELEYNKEDITTIDKLISQYLDPTRKLSRSEMYVPMDKVRLDLVDWITDIEKDYNDEIQQMTAKLGEYETWTKAELDESIEAYRDELSKFTKRMDEFRYVDSQIVKAQRRKYLLDRIIATLENKESTLASYASRSEAQLQSELMLKRDRATEIMNTLSHQTTLDEKFRDHIISIEYGLKKAINAVTKLTLNQTRKIYGSYTEAQKLAFAHYALKYGKMSYTVADKAGAFWRLSKDLNDIRVSGLPSRWLDEESLLYRQYGKDLLTGLQADLFDPQDGNVSRRALIALKRAADESYNSSFYVQQRLINNLLPNVPIKVDKNMLNARMQRLWSQTTIDTPAKRAAINSLKERLSMASSKEEADAIRGLIDSLEFPLELHGQMPDVTIDTIFVRDAVELKAIQERFEADIRNNIGSDAAVKNAFSAIDRKSKSYDKLLSTLTQDYVNTAMNMAMEDFYHHPSVRPFILGFTRIVIMDGHTDTQCAVMAGKYYDVDQRKPDLPQHLSCRCYYVPVLKPLNMIKQEMISQGIIDEGENFHPHDEQILGSLRALNMYGYSDLTLDASVERNIDSKSAGLSYINAMMNATNREAMQIAGSRNMLAFMNYPILDGIDKESLSKYKEGVAAAIFEDSVRGFGREFVKSSGKEFLKKTVQELGTGFLENAATGTPIDISSINTRTIMLNVLEHLTQKTVFNDILLDSTEGILGGTISDIYKLSKVFIEGDFTRTLREAIAAYRHGGNDSVEELVKDKPAWLKKMLRDFVKDVQEGKDEEEAIDDFLRSKNWDVAYQNVKRHSNLDFLKHMLAPDPFDFIFAVWQSGNIDPLIKKSMQEGFAAYEPLDVDGKRLPELHGKSGVDAISRLIQMIQAENPNLSPEEVIRMINSGFTHNGKKIRGMADILTDPNTPAGKSFTELGEFVSRYQSNQITSGNVDELINMTVGHVQAASEKLGVSPTNPIESYKVFNHDDLLDTVSSIANDPVIASRLRLMSPEKRRAFLEELDTMRSSSIYKTLSQNPGRYSRRAEYYTGAKMDAKVKEVYSIVDLDMKSLGDAHSTENWIIHTPDGKIMLLPRTENLNDFIASYRVNNKIASGAKFRTYLAVMDGPNASVQFRPIGKLASEMEKGQFASDLLFTLRRLGVSNDQMMTYNIRPVMSKSAQDIKALEISAMRKRLTDLEQSGFSAQKSKSYIEYQREIRELRDRIARAENEMVSSENIRTVKVTGVSDNTLLGTEILDEEGGYTIRTLTDVAGGLQSYVDDLGHATGRLDIRRTIGGKQYDELPDSVKKMAHNLQVSIERQKNSGAQIVKRVTLPTRTGGSREVNLIYRTEDIVQSIESSNKINHVRQFINDYMGTLTPEELKGSSTRSLKDNILSEFKDRGIKPKTGQRWLGHEDWGYIQEDEFREILFAPDGRSFRNIDGLTEEIDNYVELLKNMIMSGDRVKIKELAPTRVRPNLPKE